MASFKQLGLSAPLLKSISELGFENPTDIQEKSIPTLLTSERDFIGLAQTGTGKTAAFGLPLLQMIDPSDPSTQALILAPTRELGQQIAEQLNIFSKHMPRVNVLAVYGGANIVGQIKDLRRPQQVIIATPGRLIDLIKRKAVKLNELQYLVLDEADEMLNMGFKDELDKILSYTPEEKTVWLFSATMPYEIKRIVNQYMDDPQEVKVNTKNEVNVNIDHKFTVVTRANKTEALIRFIDLNPDMRAVVFCRTRRDTQELAEELLSKKYRADAIHGDLSQAQRDRVMKRFKTNEIQVLIATDVAARGIDVRDLTHVFHFTLPDDPSYYTHRSGRTARAGRKGESIAFINGREKGKINRFAKQLKIEFEKVMIPDTKDIADIRIQKWCQDILETRTKGKLDPMLLEKAKVMFGNLSKEELIAKILQKELEILDLSSTKDLNDHHGGRGEKRRYDDRGSRRGGFKKRSGGGRRGGGKRDGGGGGGKWKSKKKRRY